MISNTLFLKWCKWIWTPCPNILTEGKQIETMIFIILMLLFQMSLSHTWTTTKGSSKTKCQFHQHFTSRYFLYKSVLRSFSLLKVWFCNFFGKRILARKLLIKCCWNWLENVKMYWWDLGPGCHNPFTALHCIFCKTLPYWLQTR